MSMVDVSVTKGFNRATIVSVTDKGKRWIDKEVYGDPKADIGCFNVDRELAGELVETMQEAGLEVKED